MDRLTKEQRSNLMARVRNKDTAPEILVRKLLYSMGYRYRLHVKTLPGTPDIAFKGRRKAIFINGCFWHGHDCARGRSPRTNIDFWQAKINRNVARDEKSQHELERQGWQVLYIWQCETTDQTFLTHNINGFMGLAARPPVRVRGTLPMGMVMR